MGPRAAALGGRVVNRLWGWTGFLILVLVVENGYLLFPAIRNVVLRVEENEAVRGRRIAGKESRGMRTCRLLIALLGALCLLPLPMGAQESVLVQGEVVDLACYMATGKKGPEHKSCALLCAKNGVPMGILTDSGDLFSLIDNHDNNEPYEAAKKLAGSRAAITGQRFVKQGLASIMVTAVKGL